MRGMVRDDAFEQAVATTIRAVLNGLAAGVPFLNVHFENRPDGTVLCHRSAGRTIGSRSTDKCPVRDGGIYLRIAIVPGQEGYLCDGRWDWTLLGPMGSEALVKPVANTIRAMNAADRYCVPICIGAQIHGHTVNARLIDEERRMDAAARLKARLAYQARVAADPGARRRTDREDAPGRHTSDKKRNAITATGKSGAVW